MNMSSKTLWGVHMDVSVATDPIENEYVAIGWPQLGDLAKIPHSREAFKKIVGEKIAGAKPGSIPVQAGVLFRFVHEVKDGDLVVYPSKVDRMVNIGVFSGPYTYQPSLNSRYPNRRPVKWHRHFTREEFSQEALYEIGSFITLFAVRNNADEFLNALSDGHAASSPSVDEQKQSDVAVSRAVAIQAEETAQDFVIRQLKTALNVYEFEHFVAHLLSCPP